jgi:AraC-like DNA-binding protein
MAQFLPSNAEKPQQNQVFRQVQLCTCTVQSTIEVTFYLFSWPPRNVAGHQPALNSIAQGASPPPVPDMPHREILDPRTFLQNARESLRRNQNCAMGSIKWLKSLILVCETLASLKQWHEDEWHQLDDVAFPTELGDAISSPSEQTIDLLLAERQLHRADSVTAIRRAVAVFRDDLTPVPMKLKAGLIATLASYGFDGHQDVRRLHAEVLQLAEQNAHLPIALEATSAVLWGKHFLACAEDGWPTPAYPFPAEPRDRRRSHFAQQVQDIQQQLEAAVHACRAPHEAGPLPSFLQAMLCAQRHQHAAARSILELARQSLPAIHHDYMDVGEGVCDLFAGDVERAHLKLRHWSAQHIAQLQDCTLLQFLSFLLYRLQSERGQFEAAIQTLSVLLVDRERRILGYGAAGLFEATKVTPHQRTDTSMWTPNVATGRHARIVENAMDYIANRLSTDLQIESVVQQSGVSRRTLETAFRAETGKSIAETIKHLRLTTAARLLRAPNADIARVRASVGYASAPAFSRDFKNSFGKTPSDLKRTGNRNL